MEQYYFPFGQPLRKVEQKDKSAKEVFVLGVYASAVHATWVGKDGKQKVAALAVASEPEIFWKGDNVADIISQIEVPSELGKLLVPKSKSMNGPSGKVLDEMYLKPMGFLRGHAWLSDLLPESRVNPNQRAAIENHYTTDIILRYGLKQASIPDFNKGELNSKVRREEILSELIESKSETLVLLGDLPIQWFLKYYSNGAHRKLADFGETSDSYGKPVEMKIDGNNYNVIALCHPRQAGQLGSSNLKWAQLHRSWIESKKNR